MAMAVPDNAKIRSVTELTAEIKILLEEGIAPVWVAGEVTNYSPSDRGHHYFVLKDAGAVLPAVIWRSTAQRLRPDLRDGLEVIAFGRLDLYLPHGSYKLVVERLVARGAGAQDLALRRLKEKLAALGYFAPHRKKPLPSFPQRVALVTSPAGAAIRDMLEILGRRWPAAEVWICPVSVQGPLAPEQIAGALRLLNRLPGVDVAIVGRGGGSAEDLSAFNHELVARAIFESRIPVVSAIGHEIDVTLADLVADRRALTPSEAAELVVPDRHSLGQNLLRQEARLRELMRGRIRIAERHLRGLAERRVFRAPLQRVHERERDVERCKARFQRAIELRIAQWKQIVGAQAARLQTLSPLNVLGRGYSLTRREADGSLVRHVDQVHRGDRLVTCLLQGRITSRVEETASNEPSA